MTPDETDLRARCDAGDHDGATTAAVERYGHELFGFLIGLSGDRDRAGDAFGAMCERAWRGLSKFRWDSSLRVWLYTIARHEFLRAAVRHKRHVPLSVAPSVAEAIVQVRTATAPHLRTDVKDEFAKIRAALDPEDHMLLGLRLDRGLAWSEIARVLGDGDPAHLVRDAATLRKRYERVKARLKELSAHLARDDSYAPRVDEPPRAAEPTLDDDGGDDTTGADALRRLLNMGVRPPPPAIAAGQVIGDRFRIERQLGAGGMGVVYLARDVQLEREVAIKFTTLASQDRGPMLVREAAALAKLIHPNVVTVYEVGTWNAHAFVAMEYVRGGTARTWLAAAPRTARAIVALYVEAGRGLAAAHAAGLVHRDFKPDNVLVGDDGRVRVADFGLALGVDDDDEHAVAGTPAYMAPEQRTHGRVGAPADQFAFAVALREALASTPRIVPHVDRALGRALAEGPDDRFPSMDALLAELSRDPEARRRRAVLVAAAAGVVAALGAGGAWLAVGDRVAPPVSCAVADDALAGVWDPPRRAAVQAAFVASTRVDAAATFDRVAAELDRRARDWIATRVDACQATHVRGEQSTALLDLRMRCLDRRLDELRALVDVLTTGDAAVVDRAAEAAAALPSLDLCADGAALLAAVPLPDDPAARAAIAALEQRVADVDARRIAGRYAEALPMAEALVADAAALHFAPLAARVHTAHAAVLGELGRFSEAEAAYLASLGDAAAARDDHTSVDAWRALIELRADTDHLAGADVLVAAATAAAARLDPDDGGRAAIERALAVLAWKQGQLPMMLARATAAHAWYAAHRGGTLDEAAALQVLAMAELQSGHLEVALARNGEAVAIRVARLGADHPQVAESRMLRSNILSLMSRFDDARAELDGLLAVSERAYGPDSLMRARLDGALADVEFWQGRYGEAIASTRRALAVLRREHRDGDAAMALTRIARAASAAGKDADAVAALDEALALADAIRPPQDQLVISVLTYRGSALAAVGDYAGSQAALDRALALAVELEGADSVVVGQIENARANNASDLGEHARATAGYERALAIAEPRLGPDGIDVLYAHSNLGRELGYQGRWADAIPHFERTIAGFERVLGADHPILCAPLALVAFAYAEVGRGADGVAAGERCQAIRTARGETGDPYLELGLGAARWAAGDRVRGRAQVAAAAAIFAEDHADEPMAKLAAGWLRARR